jgi:hypothetical protein
MVARSELIVSKQNGSDQLICNLLKRGVEYKVSQMVQNPPWNLKTAVPERVPGVRIPLPPPHFKRVTSSQITANHEALGDMAELVWGCPTTSKDLKTRTMFADNWMEEKSDAFQSAYTAASCNMVSLTQRLKEAKGDFSRLPNMPNASVALVSFLHSTDYEQTVPADYQGNWYTGMCLIGAKCTDADFVPRNTSILYDAIAPQMTNNQDAAVKALYATATPEFWIAAAHANGIYDKDAAFASYAADEGLDLAKKLRHQESSSDEFAHEVEIGIGLYVAFVVVLCACFTRRTHKFSHSS